MFSGGRQRVGLTRANTAITAARVEECRTVEDSFVKYFCSSPSFGWILHLPLIHFIKENK